MPSRCQLELDQRHEGRPQSSARYQAKGAQDVGDDAVEALGLAGGVW